MEVAYPLQQAPWEEGADWIHLYRPLPHHTIKKNATFQTRKFPGVKRKGLHVYGDPTVEKSIPKKKIGRTEKSKNVLITKRTIQRRNRPGNLRENTRAGMTAIIEKASGMVMITAGREEGMDTEGTDHTAEIERGITILRVATSNIVHAPIAGSIDIAGDPEVKKDIVKRNAKLQQISFLISYLHFILILDK